MNPSELSRRCPVCGRTEAEAWLQKGELRLVRCQSCSMVYASPVPPEFVSGAYYERIAAEYYLSADKLEADHAAVRFERELGLFRKHCRSGRVLDVGCSSGGFLHQLAQRYVGEYIVLGMDVSGPALAYAESRGVPVLCGHFPQQDFGSQQFDAVTFWAVLEHLVEPNAFLQKAWEILRPKGLCFVLVPNLKSLAARLLGARYRYIYPQHVNYFTKETLAKLFEGRFSVREFRSTHFNPLVLWQDWRRGGEEISNRERAALLKRTTAYKQNPWFKPVKALYDLTEMTLGAFNLADNLAVVLERKEA